MGPTVGVGVVSSGRVSLGRALESAVAWQAASHLPGDQVVVVGNGPQPAAEAAAAKFGASYAEGPVGREDVLHDMALGLCRAEYFLWLEEYDLLLEGAVAHVRHRLANERERPHRFWKEHRNGGKEHLLVAPTARAARWGDLRGWARATLDSFGPNASLDWGTVVYLIKPYPEAW